MSWEPPLVGKINPTDVGVCLLLVLAFGVKSKLVTWLFDGAEDEESIPTTFFPEVVFDWRIILGTFVGLLFTFCCGKIIFGIGTFLRGAMLGYFGFVGKRRLAIAGLFMFVPAVELLGTSIPVMVALLVIWGSIKLVIGDFVPEFVF